MVYRYSNQWKETKVMGVDPGLRYIAVAIVGTKSLFFKGNQVIRSIKSAVKS